MFGARVNSDESPEEQDSLFVLLFVGVFGIFICAIVAMALFLVFSELLDYITGIDIIRDHIRPFFGN